MNNQKLNIKLLFLLLVVFGWQSAFAADGEFYSSEDVSLTSDDGQLEVDALELLKVCQAPDEFGEGERMRDLCSLGEMGTCVDGGQKFLSFKDMCCDHCFTPPCTWNGQTC